MKLPKIALPPSTLLKPKSEATTTPGKAASSTPPASAPTLASNATPQQARRLATSRWCIDQPMPVLSAMHNEPTKQKEPPTDSQHVHRVRFEYLNSKARAVFLVGSFNNWDASATPMDFASQELTALS
jgi:hypothetical protein